MSLVVRGLTVVERQGHRLLDAIDLDLPAWQNLIVIGATGGGKSLLAEALLGLLAPALDVHGTVRFDDGAPIAFADRGRLRVRWAERIAFLPQEPSRALDPTMRLGRQLRGRAATAAAVTRALADVDLPPTVHEVYPHMRSGGMAQRALVASVALDGAPLVVADEPTKSLDPERVDQALDLLVRLQRQGRRLVVVTHDHRVIRAIGGAAAVLEAGRLVEFGPAERVLGAPRAPYTRAWVGAEPDR